MRIGYDEYGNRWENEYCAQCYNGTKLHYEGCENDYQEYISRRSLAQDSELLQFTLLVIPIKHLISTTVIFDDVIGDLREIRFCSQEKMFDVHKGEKVFGSVETYQA